MRVYIIEAKNLTIVFQTVESLVLLFAEVQ